MTTDEQKLEVIRGILDCDFIASKNRYGNKTAQKIIEALKQFDHPTTIVSGIDHDGNVIRYEPVHVEVRHLADGFYFLQIMDDDLEPLFDGEKEAIDFCKRHGLRVKK